MNINSRPLSLNMLANVDKFAGRLGCLEVRLPWLPRLPRRDAFGRRIRGRLPWLPRLPRKMPSGGGFEGDFLGCLERCLRAANSREITLVAEVALKDAFGRRIRGRLFWPPGRLEVTGNIIDRNNVEHRRYHLRPGHRPRNRRHSHHPHERKRLLPDCR